MQDNAIWYNLCNKKYGHTFRTSSFRKNRIALNIDNDQATNLSSEASKGFDKLDKIIDDLNSTENWESVRRSIVPPISPSCASRVTFEYSKSTCSPKYQNNEDLTFTSLTISSKVAVSKKMWTTYSGGKWTAASENVKLLLRIFSGSLMCPRFTCELYSICPTKEKSKFQSQFQLKDPWKQVWMIQVTYWQ